MHTSHASVPASSSGERRNFDLVPVPELQSIKGIAFPAGMRFRQLLVTGPPGSGKTWLVTKVGGWPEEGYIDLTFKNWWRAQSLSLRPREVNLGLPFVGHQEALTVFDNEWLKSPVPSKLDHSRIILPPKKSHFFSVNWRQRFVFEFSIPSPDAILEGRLERSHREVHPVDEGVSLEEVEKQVAVYWEVALHFHQSGMMMYVRDEFNGVPKTIVDRGPREKSCAGTGG